MPVTTYEVDERPGPLGRLVHLRCEAPAGPAHLTEATVAPDKGANLCRFAVDGVEYICAWQVLSSGAEALAGTPVLYPTPNRVRNAQFSFDDRRFSFPRNKDPHHCHGLVRDVAWDWREPEIREDGISLRCSIAFEPSTPRFAWFPILSTLAFTYTLRPGAVRIQMEVCNQDSQWRLPFGLAIHPFFNIHGARRDVFIQAPATHWMAAENLLPSGRLIPIADGPADLRQNTSLSGLDLDDVVFGMTCQRPAGITYRALHKQVLLAADDFFTHAVIFTPPGKPYFCIENQSCSTDAHNLTSRGFVEEAHLAVLPPGASLRTWVDISVREML